MPGARGPVSEAVLGALGREPGPVPLPSLGGTDLLADDDAQLALTCCYELHYESFGGVDDRWEWDPALFVVTRELEDRFARRLFEEVGAPVPIERDAVVPGLRALADGDGPSLSGYMAARGTITELRELAVHRSAYQRKEADPHTWAIPRLRGRSKAALVRIQHDEYGGGDAALMHATLFATTMRALALDPTYGAHLDRLPGVTLATGNLVTMLGLHRRWRGACVGHLALFEMTSVGPMGRYAAALDRLGIEPSARRFYDVHVAADAEHERIAQEEMVTGLLGDEPELAGDVLFGARSLDLVEARFAAHLLSSWSTGHTSLLSGGPRVALAPGGWSQVVDCCGEQYRPS